MSRGEWEAVEREARRIVEELRTSPARNATPLVGTERFTQRVVRRVSQMLKGDMTPAYEDADD